MKLHPIYLSAPFLFLWSCTTNEDDFSHPDIEKSQQTNSVQTYYWHGEHKIPLWEQTDLEFVLFNSSDKTEIIIPQNMNYRKLKSNSIEQQFIAHNSTRSSTHVSWAIGNTRGFTANNDKILYRSKTYRNSKGEDIYISHLFYVKLNDKNDYSVLEQMASTNNVEILGNAGGMDLWYKLACNKSSSGDALSMANKFQESGLFKYAQPDIMFELTACDSPDNFYHNYKSSIIRSSTYGTPNDPFFPQQWNLSNQEKGGLDINYLAAKQITQGSENIKIAVIDVNQIEKNHPDLPELYFERNFVESDPFHGTNCAGIISAKTDNNIGISGIAPNCKLIFIGISPILNAGMASMVAEAFSEAARLDVDVISCSWQFNTPISDDGVLMLYEVIYKQLILDGRSSSTNQHFMGTVIVFAAGNDNGSIRYPANSESEIIVVGAVGKNGERYGESTTKSNYGNELDLVAPGENIITTTAAHDNYGNQYYDPLFGYTSAACPQVAATAALILSINPYLSCQEVARYIGSTAKKINPHKYFYDSYHDEDNHILKTGSWNEEVGYGLLDVGAALQAVINDMN